MNRLLRGALLESCRRAGVISLMRRRHRFDVAILMLHGVMEAHSGSRWRPLRPQLSPTRLDQHLRTLSRHYRFVTLTEAVDMIAGRIPVRPYSVAITFDDGYRNNLTHAWPILRRYGAPATIFVATGHIDRREPYWFDRLDYALQMAHVDGREVPIGSTSVRLDARDRAALAASYRALRDRAKAAYSNDLEMLRAMTELAGQLERESGCALADFFEDDDWSALLTWDAIRGSLRDGLSYGSHTVDHVRLPLVPENVAAAQLAESKRCLEERLDEPCVHLAYPNGSYDNTAIALAARCGYTAALTSDEGLNRPNDSALRLRRVGVAARTTAPELLARACGLSSFLGRTGVITLYNTGEARTRAAARRPTADRAIAG